MVLPGGSRALSEGDAPAILVPCPGLAGGKQLPCVTLAAMRLLNKDPFQVTHGRCGGSFHIIVPQMALREADGNAALVF